MVYGFILGWSHPLKAIPALILFAIQIVFPMLSKPTKYLLIATSFISLLIFTGKTKAVLEFLLFLDLGFLLLYAGYGEKPIDLKWTFKDIAKEVKSRVICDSALFLCVNLS